MRWVQKFLNWLKIIDNKVRESQLKDASSSKASASASASKDDAFVSASEDDASASKKAEKECFLKHFFKNEVDPEPEDQDVDPVPKDQAFMEPLFLEEVESEDQFSVELDWDRLLTKILEDDASASSSKDNDSASMDDGFTSTSRDDGFTSTSKDDPSASIDDAFNSKKAEKERFLKDFFKKEVDPELEDQDVDPEPDFH
ncbi:uncharacterized protein LOC117630483 [Prunus dulcis]|uniref:uncharacterized protein LOC117630483 n=1 Tax=Prunus dulcis TaxID=3755 RepID=UPI0014822C7C|nr:uncharacterized protein LOC117630483 [Prunus dulcis]